MAKATIDVWTGKYEGGAYIDVYHAAKRHALDVINVYDYEAGAPTIENTSKAVRAKLAEWIKECGEDYERELPYL